MYDVLDLFSGIGGFSLGLERAGFRTRAFCEIDPYCRKVLARHWPEVKIHEDVTKLDGNQYAGTVDVVCGGYPCQPFSAAGKQLGEDDPRHLWPEMRRIIREARPRWVIAENVRGHVTLGFDTVAAQLEDDGFSVWAFIVPACAVNAPHRRDRLWIVAHTKREGLPSRILERADQRPVIPAAMGLSGFENTEWQTWHCPPELPLLAYGLSEKLDEHATVALGNAVVPQIPELIGRAIIQYEASLAA